MSKAVDQMSDNTDYVTATVGGQLFGIPISRVQDVFKPDRLTQVPLSSNDIAGVLNLRGRIVTAIDMRARLGLPKDDVKREPMAIGVDLRGESYGLMIDAIGDVVRVQTEDCEINPANLDPWLSTMAAGVHRMGTELMVVLDIDRVLSLNADLTAD
jgi:purine-binding chemotaxis protein CheW